MERYYTIRKLKVILAQGPRDVDEYLDVKGASDKLDKSDRDLVRYLLDGERVAGVTRLDPHNAARKVASLAEKLVAILEGETQCS